MADSSFMCTSMSILKYFTAERPNGERIILPEREMSGVTSTEFDQILVEVKRKPDKRKRTTYLEEDKSKLAKHANRYGTANTIKQFKRDFPNLSESTVRPWLDKYRAAMKSSSLSSVLISEKRGRPLLLPDELDKMTSLIKSSAHLSAVQGLQVA